MIVGQPEQNVGRQLLPAALLACSHESAELVQEFIHAELVRIFNPEIREIGIEVAPQFWFSGKVVGGQRNAPGIRTGRAMRLSHIGRQRLSFFHLDPRALTPGWGGRALLGGLLGLGFAAP
jgi:hypothetical protein